MIFIAAWVVTRVERAVSRAKRFWPVPVPGEAANTKNHAGKAREGRLVEPCCVLTGAAAIPDSIFSLRVDDTTFEMPHLSKENRYTLVLLTADRFTRLVRSMG